MCMLLFCEAGYSLTQSSKSNVDAVRVTIYSNLTVFTSCQQLHFNSLCISNHDSIMENALDLQITTPSNAKAKIFRFLSVLVYQGL